MVNGPWHCHTLTTGDSYKSNGRVEGELGVIKKHVRTVVASSDLGLDKWPLAAIHIGERRLRGQLRSLGFPSGPLLKFGAKAYALKKSWQERYQPWREVRDEVTVLGPAIQSALTTTSYYVQSIESQRYFYTDGLSNQKQRKPWFIFRSWVIRLQGLCGKVGFRVDVCGTKQLCHNFPCCAWRGRELQPPG